MFENKENREEAKDLSKQFLAYDRRKENENELIDKLEAVIKSTSDLSPLEKRKMLKEIPNVRNGNNENFKLILSRIDINHSLELLKEHSYVYGKDEKGNAVKISGQAMFYFVHRVGEFNRNKTHSAPAVRDEYDIFVDNVLKIIKKNRNSKGDYYNYFKSRQEIWSVTGGFENDKRIKRILIDLYVESRLNAKNEKLDKELPFLSFDVLLSKYNELVREKAKKTDNETEFIEKYGAKTIIEEGNKIIKDKLTDFSLFSYMGKGYEITTDKHIVDLYRATEYMSISEVVSFFKDNIQNFNVKIKSLEESRENDKYGTRAEHIEDLKAQFNEFKKYRLPRIVNILKDRLIKEGLVSKSIDEKKLSAKICSELLDIDSIYGDYSKKEDIGLKSIISQSDYFVKKKQFESLSPFGILKIKQKQKQLGMPRNARLF